MRYRDRLFVAVLIGPGAARFRAQSSSQAATALPFAISVPEGFKIELVSTGIGRARFIAVAPRRRRPGLADIARQGRSRIAGRRAAGRAEESWPRASSFPTAWPSAAPTSTSRPGRESSSIPDYPRGSARVLFSNLPRNGMHNARSLAVAPDGSVFVAIRR